MPKVYGDSLDLERVWNAYGIHMAPETVRIGSLTPAAEVGKTEPFSRSPMRWGDPQASRRARALRTVRRTAPGSAAPRGRGRGRRGCGGAVSGTLSTSIRTGSRTSAESATADTGRLSASLHLEGHPGRLRQQRAAPAPRPERRHRRQREDAGADRQDRPVCRVVVGGGAGRGADERAVGHELGQALAAVDEDAQLRRLRSGAQDRDLVDRQRLDHLAVGAGRPHPERVEHRLLGRRQPLDQARPRRSRSSGSRRCRGSCRRPGCRALRSRAGW